MILQRTAILLLPVMLAAQFGTVTVSVDDGQLKENDRRVTQGIDEQIQYFFVSTVWDDEYSDLEIPLTVHLFFQSVADKGGQRLYGVQCLFTNGSDQRYFAKSVQFPYSQGQGVSYSPVIFEPLASFLEFYGVIILAGEADTYNILGGTRFYERAREIALRGMSSQYTRGWRQRSEVVNIISKNKPLRIAKFHFYDGVAYLNEGDPTEAAAAFDKMLDNLEENYRQAPREHYSSIFLDAHARDLVLLPPYLPNRNKILKVMLELDPDNEDSYRQGLGIKSR